MKKTAEEHFEYVKKLARVSFFYARCHLMPRFPESKISELIKKHTPLLYEALGYHDYETGWDNPDCRAILDKADELSALSPTDFEEEMWNSIELLARCRVADDYSHTLGAITPESWNCGSLKYGPPQKKRPPEWCAFHIANAVAPKSIFADSDYLPACFRLLLTESSIIFGYTVLYTCSWLNDREEWLRLFPDEWRRNLSPRSEKPVPEWNFGWWGQLVNARGSINPKAESFVRANGFLKYECRTSHCGFDDMFKHLEQIKND